MDLVLEEPESGESQEVVSSPLKKKVVFSKLLGTNKIDLQFTMRSDYLPVRIAKIEKTDHTKSW